MICWSAWPDLGGVEYSKTAWLRNASQAVFIGGSDDQRTSSARFTLSAASEQTAPDSR